MIAEGLRSRNVQRAFWYAAALMSLFCLVLTASRGGVVAALAGAFAVLFVLRREVSAARVLTGAVVTVLVVAATIAVLASTRYGDVMYQRFVLETLQQGSAWEASSGRTGLWLAAIDRMAEHPLTFLTGYGWRVYFALGFWGAPHNTYLDFWFNLGLPGLFSLLGILGFSIRWVARAARRAGGALRTRLHAALAGIVGVSVGLLFTEWYAPWLYFWAYLGLALRMVVISASDVPAEAEVSDSVQDVEVRRDRYGWVKTR
jgi:O-antigen ligase